MNAWLEIADWYMRFGLGEALFVILFSEPKSRRAWIRHIYIWGPMFLVNIAGKGKG